MRSESISRRSMMARCGLLLAGAGALGMAKTGLRVGMAETVITPSWPTRLWGYNRTKNPFSEGILDDIYAKAILFDSGQRFLLITADIGAIGLDLSRKIAVRVREAIGIPEDAVAIQVTHDHSAPSVLGIPAIPADTKFQQLLEDRIVEIARKAQQNLTPAALELGQVASSIALNRRVNQVVSNWDNDSGPIDQTLSVVLVRALSGRYLGALVNYAAHAVCLRDDNNKVSADFPGVLYRRLSTELGCPVMFMQGCCGDEVPKMFGTVKEMEAFGARMAEEALRAVAVAQSVKGDSVDYKTRHISLEYVAPYSLSEFQSKAGEYAKGPFYVPEWAKLYLQYLEKGGATQQAHPSMVEALRVGDLHFALLPGEVLHLTSLLIRGRFPGVKLVVGSYTNDTSTGYLPNAVEFPKGGYEVERSWKLYGILKTTPEMEQTVRETAIELLHSTAGVG
ncbi:MAG TPA: neutral/alkaline non-lysosomal ceramidase N-terminal domain-containing protein [Bryobacteraceae bacterium]|nr:neutral/alkaline non-lysosomal ceramidase N-terminal domain-containing protein [Bryobacteraceae bacterium]